MNDAAPTRPLMRCATARRGSANIEYRSVSTGHVRVQPHTTGALASVPRANTSPTLARSRVRVLGPNCRREVPCRGPQSVARNEKRTNNPDGYTQHSRPQIMCGYPLNLSILIRGGRETNKDSLSSCERNGTSSARRGGAFTRAHPVPCTGTVRSLPALVQTVQVQLECGFRSHRG